MRVKIVTRLFFRKFAAGEKSSGLYGSDNESPNVVTRILNVAQNDNCQSLRVLRDYVLQIRFAKLKIPDDSDETLCLASDKGYERQPIVDVRVIVPREVEGKKCGLQLRAQESLFSFDKLG